MILMNKYISSILASNDYQVNFPERTKETVFDGNLETYWGSITPVKDRAFIGATFEHEITIQKIILKQYHISGSNVTKVSVQTSSDGISWIDIKEFSVGISTNELLLDNALRTKYCRIMAKTETVQGAWAWNVLEIEFYGGDSKILIRQSDTSYVYYGQNPTTLDNEWINLGESPTDEDWLNKGTDVVTQSQLEKLSQQEIVGRFAVKRL